MSETGLEDRSSLIVAIDGPSGVGKTTVASLVAKELELPYLSTGAMYRSVALKVIEQGVEADDREAVEEMARDIDLSLRLADDGQIEVFVDGEPSGDRIKGLKVAQTTSQISAYSDVRKRLVALQREWATRHGAVLEGRDIGTKVFPDTPHKFFLEAPTWVRVERRWLELRARGRTDLVRSEVEREFLERDRRDRTRPDSPLCHDETYSVIDTSGSEPWEVVEKIVAEVRAKSEPSAGGA
ncbi:MAG: (d)CMP kinase [Acidobacteriota bacterium]|nr:(d)CMP kinase [Acidobacteriota bacterium]